MTKKLSEIGKQLSRHPVDGGLVPFDPELIEHSVCILTLEERRELVRNSIKKFILAYVESYWLKDALGICIDKLCEEQGI